MEDSIAIKFISKSVSVYISIHYIAKTPKMGRRKLLELISKVVEQRVRYS